MTLTIDSAPFSGDAVQPPLSNFGIFLSPQKETQHPVSRGSHALPLHISGLSKLSTHSYCTACPPRLPAPRRKWALCSGDQSGRLTCSHEEDASTEDDVVLAAVEPPGTDAEPAEQEQDGAEDGEDAGGAHDAWAGREAGQRGW